MRILLLSLLLFPFVAVAIYLTWKVDGNVPF
jgi:hypothetical protein